MSTTFPLLVSLLFMACTADLQDPNSACEDDRCDEASSSCTPYDGHFDTCRSEEDLCVTSERAPNHMTKGTCQVAAPRGYILSNPSSTFTAVDGEGDPWDESGEPEPEMTVWIDDVIVLDLESPKLSLMFGDSYSASWPDEETEVYVEPGSIMKIEVRESDFPLPDDDILRCEIELTAKQLRMAYVACYPEGFRLLPDSQVLFRPLQQ